MSWHIRGVSSSPSACEAETNVKKTGEVVAEDYGSYMINVLINISDLCLKTNYSAVLRLLFLAAEISFLTYHSKNNYYFGFVKPAIKAT